MLLTIPIGQPPPDHVAATTAVCWGKESPLTHGATMAVPKGEGFPHSSPFQKGLRREARGLQPVGLRAAFLTLSGR